MSLPKLDTTDDVLEMLMNGQFQGYENERDWRPMAEYLAECVRLRQAFEREWQDNAMRDDEDASRNCGESGPQILWALRDAMEKDK